MKKALIFIFAALLGIGAPYATEKLRGNLLGAGTVLTVPQGGTGTSTLTRGDFLVATSTNRFYNFGIGGSNQVMIVSNGLPVWSPSVTTTNVYVSELSTLNGTSTFNNTIFATGTTGGTPASGPGTRLMWIPSKAAFRVGVVDGTQWDNSNIGQYSIAMGYNSQATGQDGTAVGYFTSASGLRGTAIGNGASAIGSDSVAAGQSAAAWGPGSTAFGRAATTFGQFATAIGNLTVAEGVGSTALGNGTYILGKYSTMIGLNSAYIPASKTSYLENTFIVAGGNSTFGTTTWNPAVLNISASSTAGTIFMAKSIPGFTGDFLDFKNSSDVSQFIVNSSGQIGVGTSTPKSIFQIEDNTQTTTTLWVGSLSRPGVTCFGDSDGVGATCAYFNNGVAYYYSTSTY